MTALAGDRATIQMDGGTLPGTLSVKVKTATTIYQGSIVAVDATGYAVSGLTSTAVTCIGMATEQVVNAGASGAKEIAVSPGIFSFANSSAGDEITITEIGDFCYLVDDQTVAKTDDSGTRSRCGKVVRVDTGGVWVAINPYVEQGYATVTGTETLTNKTLTTPTIASMTNATHDHADAAGGGTLASPRADGGAIAITAGVGAIAAPTIGAVYDVGTTDGATIVTVASASATGEHIEIVADGTKNGHTVQIADAVAGNLTAALTASKILHISLVSYGTVWHANAHIAP